MADFFTLLLKITRSVFFYGAGSADAPSVFGGETRGSYLIRNKGFAV